MWHHEPALQCFWLKDLWLELFVCEHWLGLIAAQTAIHLPLTALQDSHYTFSVLALSAGLGPNLTLLAWSGWRKGWRLELLVCEHWLGHTTWPLRQPSITPWHPFKTHTTPESVLAPLACCLGPNLVLLAWFDGRKGWRLELLAREPCLSLDHTQSMHNL